MGNSRKVGISLANKDCIFDSGEFDTIEVAMAWAQGRGGRYKIHIQYGDRFESFTYDDDEVKLYADEEE